MILIELVLFLATLASDDFCFKQLDNLLEWHIKYGLPLPPRNAELVRFVTEPQVYHQTDKKIVEPGSPGLGFSFDGILWPYTNGDGIASIKCVKPDPALLHGAVWSDLRTLAVVAHERKWKPLALAAFRERTLVHGWRNTEREIAEFAWHHWESRIHGDPDTPLPLIAKYLKRALPLNDCESNRSLVRSVELATKPRNSPPGSDDALIDKLVSTPRAEHPPYQWQRGWRDEPQHKEIIRRGLDIVPALIAHLDDDRIVRVDRRPAWQRTAEHPRIRDVVFDILVELHGGQFEVNEDTRNARLAAIGKWFGAAHKLGEEKYVISRLLGDDEADDFKFQPSLFWLLTEKYPQRLPDVFLSVIDTRPKLHNYAWAFASAVAEAPSPPDEKRKVLEHAATQAHPVLRAAGIYHLQQFDPKLAKRLLLATIAKMPDRFDDAEAWLARLVAEGRDSDEWKALGFAMRRADVRGRICLIQEVGRSKSPAGRKHRILFFAEHLTDDESYEGPPHYVWLSRFEVQALATIHLVRLLEIESERPHENWTAAQWAELRAKVQTRLKEELQR